VDHDAAPARKPRVGSDELVHEHFDREQQIALAVRDCGTIVADRNGMADRHAQPRHRCRNVPLGRDAVAYAELSRNAIERDGPEHERSLTRFALATTGSRSPGWKSAGNRRGRPASSDAA